VVDQGSSYEARLRDRLKSNDRIILLKKMEGKNTLDSKGMVDNRLFSGDNKLHAILDSETGLWSLKFEKGLMPGALDAKFTKFSKVVEKVKEYYDKRNVEIDKIID